jgi:tetratricopeptide (TPR) repeat protein
VSHYLGVIYKLLRGYRGRGAGFLLILAFLGPLWAADTTQEGPSHDQALELVQRGELKAAEEEFLELLRLNPQAYAVQHDLAALYFSQRRYEVACPHFAQAAKLNPRLAPIQQNLGVCLFQINDFPKAVEALEKAKVLDPEDLRTRFVLGSGWALCQKL